MGDKKNKLFEFFTEQFNLVMMALFAFQVAIFVFTYAAHAGNFILTIVTFGLIFIFFVLGKDFATENQKRLGFALFKISILIFLFTTINDLFLMLGAKMPGSSSTKSNALFQLSYFINLILLIGAFAFMRKDTTKQTFDNMYENSMLSKLGIKTPSSEKKMGDVKLCINKDNKKDEILPFKDRFLHMLILGPTGSGKTSQTILPMINQDMQNFDAGLTVIEPKADLAEKVSMMAKHYGRKYLYFNPILPNCPYFNPLHGKEDDVIENMATTFKMLNPDSPQFFLDMNENLIRNALKVLKRMMGNDATLIDLHRIISNPSGIGRKMVMQFSRINAETAEVAKENSDIASWFLNDYFNEKSKTYEHCSGVRTQVSKITSNRYLRKILNPPAGKNDIDFDKHLEEGGVIAIATAQGTLRDLGRFLGYFIILQFQASVFRRPGNENTRRAHFLYIDEFQVYANPGFADMLTQGRSYRVASQLATQNRALIGMGRGQEGKDFVELVSTNARNIIIYPGGNALDAKYYSDQFGEILRQQVQKGVSRAKFNPLYGFQKISYPNESVRVSEQLEARFSPSDLMYRPFGEITYCLIKNNSIQTPGVGKIEYIPVDLNQKLDQMIEEFHAELERDFPDNLPKQEEIPDDIEPVVQPEPVLAKNPAPSNAGQKGTTSKPNREYIPTDTDFTDDVVIDASDSHVATDKDGSSETVGMFMSEEEDELI